VVSAENRGVSRDSLVFLLRIKRLRWAIYFEDADPLKAVDYALYFPSRVKTKFLEDVLGMAFGG
jgi:hypothetical protein